MKKITALRSLFLILSLTLSALPVLSYTITVMVKPGWTETLYKLVKTEECELDPTFDLHILICKTITKKVVTGTKYHPPEYDVYKVPAGTPPGDIERIINETTSGTPLAGKVTITEGTPTAITGGIIRSTTTVNSLVELRNEIQNDITEAQESNDQLTSTDNSSAGGDPVLFATGDFVTSSTDAAFSMAGTPVEVTRSFNASKPSAGAFGPGWLFNYDSRIIRGIKPRAATHLASVREKRSSIQDEYDKAKKLYDDSLTDINAVISRALTIRNTIRQTVRSLESSVSSAPSHFTSILQSDLRNARSKLQVAEAFLTRSQRAKTALEAKYPDVLAMRSQLLDAQERLTLATNELAITRANTLRNAKVVTSTDPAWYTEIGIDSVLYINQEGISKRYSIDTAPSYASTAVYADGSKNYYPQGSDTTAAQPNDDQLRLNPNGSYTLTQKDGTVIAYGFFGTLQSITDPNGNTITFTYNAQDKLTTVTDAFSRTLSLTWSGDRLTAVTDPVNRTWTYSYTGGRLTGITDPADHTVSFTYSGGLLTRITKPDNSYRQYEYARQGTRTVTTRTFDEMGNPEVFTYNFPRRYTDYTNPSGVVERHYYNERSLETKIEYSDGTALTNEYDENDNLTRVTDRRGGVTSFTYDTRRNMLSRTDELGYTERWSYSTRNDITGYTDKAGQTTRFTYDTRGNLTGITHPDASAESFQYDTHGQITRHTDEQGNAVSYTYDDFGNLSTVTDAGGFVWRYVHDRIGNLTSQTDPAGHSTAYTYNGDNELTSVTHPDGTTETYTYNNRKLIASYTDRRGGTTSYEYNAKRDLIRLTNPLGHITTFTPRADGKLLERSIAGIQTTRYTYNNLGRMTSEIQVESNQITSYAYDASGNLFSLTDPEGGETLYTYNARDELISVRDPLTFTENFTYSAAGNLLEYQDRGGHKTTYTYDSRSRRLTRTDPPLGTSRTSSAVSRYEYDRAGRLTAEVDPLSNRTAYAYDPRGLLASITNAAGGSRGFTYDSRGNRTGETDTRGHTTTYTYDSDNRITAVTDPLGNTETYTYDAAGNLTGITDPNGNRTTAAFDALNRKTSAVDPAGHTQSWTYNPLGSPLSYTDQAGNIRRTGYDSLQRPTTQSDPLGHSSTFTYDRRGLITQWNDPEGRGTHYTYDAAGRLTAKTNALNQRYTYTYDPRGLLTGETDPAGVTHAYRYNSRALLIGETNRLGGTQSYTYDNAGNRITHTDYNGLTKTYTYNALNQRTNETHGSNSFAEWTYDGEGNLLTAKNTTTRQSYTYDPAGRLTQSTDSLANQSTLYTYDAAGNRLTQILADGRSGTRITNTYTYTNRNLIDTVTDFQGGRTRFTYDALGRKIRRELPSSLIDSYTYDAAGSLTSHKITRENSPGFTELIEAKAHLYNRAGQRIYDVDHQGRVSSYRYDQAARLIEASYPQGIRKENTDFETIRNAGLTPPLPGREPEDFFEYLEDNPSQFYNRLQVPPAARLNLSTAYEALGAASPLRMDQYQWSETYTYDTQGNRTGITIPWGSTLTSTYDAANRQLSSGSRRFTYDANGNLITDTLGTERTAYTYNGADRMTGVNTTTPIPLANQYPNQATAAQYHYDALGRRVQEDYRRTQTTPGTGGRTNQRMDQGTQITFYDALSFNPIARSDYRGQTRSTIEANGTVSSQTRSFGDPSPKEAPTYAGNELILQTGLRIYREDARTLVGFQDETYLHRDQLGSTILTSSASGEDIRHVNYDAFGQVLSPNASIDTPNHLYNGKPRDPMTQLVNYGFRDYNSRQGRFTTVDPIRSGENWYGYVVNDPLNLIDLYGLIPQDTLTDGSSGSSPTNGTDAVQPTQNTPVIDSTKDAVKHYLKGNGEPVELGPKTKSALENSKEQEYRSDRIRTGKTTRSSGNYGVDLTREVYHVGDTTVQYDTECNGGTCTTTYTGFTRNFPDGSGYGPDGFWDIPSWANDTVGPRGEFGGGTPYPYIPHRWKETYPNPNQDKEN